MFAARQASRTDPHVVEKPVVGLKTRLAYTSMETLAALKLMASPIYTLLALPQLASNNSSLPHSS